MANAKTSKAALKKVLHEAGIRLAEVVNSRAGLSKPVFVKSANRQFESRMEAHRVLADEYQAAWDAYRAVA